MAKLHSYYGLCPIIDQYSLLGIAEDCEKGHAIVTLDKNICIKYRIADQKQINSWRTKDKFSSPVLYDWQTERYVAAFNQSYLRIWDKDEEQVDKQKKFKFNNSIQTLISYLQQTFVIFTNGIICDLNTALEQRKSMKSDGIVKNEGYISDVLYTNVEHDIYIGLIIENVDKKEFYWTKFTNSSLSEFASFELKSSDDNLVGYMFNKPNKNEDLALLTIWSNAKLYILSLYKNMDSSGLQYSVIESLSSEFCITMLPLDQDYIAMYGADKNGEGATLILYNIQFKLVQSKQMFKMFKNQAKIWQIDNNLLMCVGQNLAVVPFQLETEQLAALVGSHKMLTLDKDQDLIIKEELQTDSWDEQNLVASRINVPFCIKEKVIEMTKQGYTDVTICEVIIPELIEKKDVKAIKSSLKFFYDIPESCTAKLLKFILNVDDSHFKSLKNEKDVILQPYQRRILLDMLLQLPFNNLHLMPHVRKELNVTDVIVLLKYIMYVLSDDEEAVSLSFETQLINWSSFLLDANYQKLILANDDKVIEFLKSFEIFIKHYLIELKEIDEAVPYLHLKRKITDGTKHVSYITYSIEDITLF